MAQNKVQEAFKISKLNYDKNQTAYTTNVGMGRAYSALGKYKKALEYPNTALPLAPGERSKNFITGMIEKLREGKDINRIIND